MRPTHRHRHGVSLTEVVVAIFIFGTACLALLCSQSALTTLRTRATLRWTLAATAIDILDSLRAAPCAALTSATRSTREGNVAWIATSQAQVVHLQLNVSPNGSTPWRTETLVPCAS